MGKIFSLGKRELPDKDVLNVTFTNEYQEQKIRPKLLVRGFVKRSTYINYDIDGYEFRNDFQISEVPTTIELSRYCKPGNNEILLSTDMNKPVRLLVNLKNNHRKFTLEFGVINSGFYRKYGTLEQPFNHEHHLLSKPLLTLTDNEQVYSEEVLSTSITIDINQSITLYNSRMNKLYTWRGSGANQLYFKVLSDELLQSDIILSRSSL